MEPKPVIETVPYLSQNSISIEVLRLDQIHPIVSGNKWYKLRYYIQAALESNSHSIASFGGPFSNHLVALAYTAKINGLKSIGYVRSNKEEPITPTLQEALHYGMELNYLGRTMFQSKKEELLKEFRKLNDKQLYFIDEGGYGQLGANGASTIMSNCENTYDYIICAVGTGTMIAGIINAASKKQTVIGIPILKNEGSIKHEIQNLQEYKNANFILLNEFHQGGYAKTTPEQISFMNRFWKLTNIPTDIVYTGKVFYAVNKLLEQKFFKENSKVLIIHSGGLQGNRSLEKGVLHY